MRLNLQKAENECKTRDNQFIHYKMKWHVQDETIAKAKHVNVNVLKTKC
jgi:hypothetical protein